MSGLHPEAVRPLLTGRLGQPYLYRESCGSTQELLDPALDEGAVAVCDHQTSGRGRLGRSWAAPAGSALLCSVLLRPPAGRRSAELSLVMGLAVAETVESLGAGMTEIKWPNDVMLAGRKLAGVLAEARADSVVLGVGLNVNQTEEQLPAGPRYPATSLFTHDGVTRERAPILARLLERLEERYEGWRARGLEAMLEEIRARDFLGGRTVRVSGVAGRARGIDRHGRLEIATDDGLKRIESGEVDYAR